VSDVFKEQSYLSRQDTKKISQVNKQKTLPRCTKKEKTSSFFKQNNDSRWLTQNTESPPRFQARALWMVQHVEPGLKFKL